MSELGRTKPSDTHASTGIGAIVITRVRHKLKDTPSEAYNHAKSSDLVRAAVAFIAKDETLWPWSIPAFEPHDDTRDNLVEAGALIAAAIDALDKQRTQSIVDDALAATDMLRNAGFNGG